MYTLRGDKKRKADNGLIMRVDHEWEFWWFFESARRQASNAQPWERAHAVWGRTKRTRLVIWAFCVTRKLDLETLGTKEGRKTSVISGVPPREVELRRIACPKSQSCPSEKERDYDLVMSTPPERRSDDGFDQA